VSGCKRRQPNPNATIEEEGELESVVQVANPAVSGQILHGFHAVENNSWRWSMRTFAVSLRPPQTTATTATFLEMKFSVPDAILPHIRGASLAASVEDAQLPPVRIESAGAQTYRQRVPQRALEEGGRARESVTVEFSLDHAVQAGKLDSRELGLVVTQIGLVAQ
jgi:hypothetical protein